MFAVVRLISVQTYNNSQQLLPNKIISFYPENLIQFDQNDWSSVIKGCFQNLSTDSESVSDGQFYVMLDMYAPRMCQAREHISGLVINQQQTVVSREPQKSADVDRGCNESPWVSRTHVLVWSGTLRVQQEVCTEAQPGQNVDSFLCSTSD